MAHAKQTGKDIELFDGENFIASWNAINLTKSQLGIVNSMLTEASQYGARAGEVRKINEIKDALELK